ncbi:nucleoside recognition domain-containing protein [Paenibacillus tepidiphilus]|uniref:nucleoside recognition domain-containing protein n=1 Tax=Paenibacillus tepidiphilus TaxID=2608683 RepID=UPI0012398C27|nr:nucleoside recognition domain-containing protein [Paenibacillus tepidiphilus]
MNHLKIRRIASGTAPFLSGALAILLAAAIVASPESAFQASLQGLKLWWTLVFPALLPFLMLSEMLTASGVVHGLGVLLEPVMTRVFRLPGAGGWLLTLGMNAGFPAGAAGAAQLYKQGSLSGREARRLAALSHFASPVTLLIVVGIGFLQHPGAGYALLAIHWGSGLLAGFTTARVAGRLDAQAVPDQPAARRSSWSKRAVQAAAEARASDGRSFGKLLGDSVASAVQQLMIVGGYMIIFAVVIQIAARLIPWLPAVVTAGLLELHLGANAIAPAVNQSSAQPAVWTAGLLSAALAWSGICGQLQALSALKPAGARYLPYAAARLLHAVYAFLLTLLLWKPLLSGQAVALPAAIFPAGTASTGDDFTALPVWSTVPRLLGVQSAVLLLLLACSAVIYVAARFRQPRR